jgi:ABC-type transport system involved in cytochrome c biogenesis permease component
MVGPSLSDEERTLANARLKLGFVLLVAASAGLVALQVGGSPLQLGAAVGAGLALGLALLAFLLRLGREFRRSS